MTDAPPDDGAPPQGQLPAKQPTEAEWRRDRMEALLTQLEQRGEQLGILLADTGIGFPRFLEVIRRAFIRNPDLIHCDPASLIEACINAATDGLLPDGRAAAIVVYRVNAKKRKTDPDIWIKKANYQPMYQGLLDLAYSSGNFQSIECRVVYDGDAFEYDLGDQPFIRHRPKTRPAGQPQPPLIAAYAVARTVNGGIFREVFEGADIAKVNAVSRATNGPGKNWPEEMARKGPLRRMWKFIPKNEAMNKIVERDNDGYDLGAAEEPEAAPERTLSPGFAKAPAALPQGADPTMPDMTVPPMEEGERTGAAGEGQWRDYAESAASGGPGPQPPSNPAAKSNAAPVLSEEGDFTTDAKFTATQHEGGRSVEPNPGAVSFETALSAAGNLKTVKAVVEAFCQTEMGKQDWAGRGARARAWGRMLALRAEGKDKTDFIADPLLFEWWLLGADPTREDVEGNWAILQEDKAFGRLDPADLARITTLVGEILGADDGG